MANTGKAGAAKTRVDGDIEALKATTEKIENVVTDSIFSQEEDLFERLDEETQKVTSQLARSKLRAELSEAKAYEQAARFKKWMWMYIGPLLHLVILPLLLVFVCVVSVVGFKVCRFVVDASGAEIYQRVAGLSGNITWVGVVVPIGLALAWLFSRTTRRRFIRILEELGMRGR